jgi:uncharacterized protein (DUF2225 family)
VAACVIRQHINYKRLEDMTLSNLFSGLEAFGFNNLSDIDVYDKKEKANKKPHDAIVKNTIDEADVIFDKTYVCPVCDKEFKSKMVKSGKAKLVSLDTDLRPKYRLIDPLKYDAIACPYCGYTALNRFFKYVTATQAKLIKTNISGTFKGLKKSGEVYTYDDAILRHKLALVNAIVKKSKTSERAYICLKLAWIIRGKAENFSNDAPDYKEQIAGLNKEEIEFITKAYDGFKESFSKESFPMCGMDENTVTLLVAELARRLGRYDEAGRWISQILIAKDANERIKIKAREIKAMIQTEK